MNTMTLTFDTPDPKEIKIDMSFFDDFDKNGRWGDDPRDAYEIAETLIKNRTLPQIMKECE